MKTIRIMILGMVIMLSSLLVSCQKEEGGKPVEPVIEVAELVEVDAEGGIVEIPLVSSYPWFASTNADWFKVTKYRGQMKLKEKIIIEVQENLSGPREAGLQVKLMDQLTVNVIIRQAGR